MSSSSRIIKGIKRISVDDKDDQSNTSGLIDQCLTNLGDLMEELDEVFEHVEATEDVDSLSRADSLIEDLIKAIRDLRVALVEKARIVDPDTLEVEDTKEKVVLQPKQLSANSNGVVGKLNQVTLPKV